MQAHDLFFSSISLVTGSPRILCTRRLEGGGRGDFTPREMSGGSLKNPKNQSPQWGKKKKTPPSRTSEVWRAPDGARFKRENVYKVEQDVGRVGKKTYPRVTSPFFFLLNPAGFPFLFFCQKKKKIVFLLIHRKVWLGCSNLAYLGVLESLVFPPALPGAQVLGGDFLGAGEAGTEDAAAAAAAAPRGAVSAGEGGAAAGSGGSQALAPEGTQASVGGRRRPFSWPRVAAGAARTSCWPPTRQRRQEARVSSRSLFLRDSLRRAREPPRPPSALSWRSSPSAAAGGSPRRTQGLRGRALGGVAPAGWLRLPAALSGAASGPSEAPG